MVLEVLGENLFGPIKLDKNNSVHQADRKVDPPRTRITAVVSSIPARLDLKPENVLICIDDVESIISTELTTSSATASTQPNRLVGSLPSPSPAFSDSPMLDKWVFGMLKIEGDDSMAKSSTSMDKDALMTQRTHPPSQSTDLAGEVAQVSLDIRGSSVGRGGPAGPSLLSQTAPSATRPVAQYVLGKSIGGMGLAPGSAISIDCESHEDSSALY
ncbi:hypothetical protein CPB84DRAFT_1854809 [Gymnopilus junonius]|uniref:Uncharacterized protein n=1 Tax=Gymnopilus junonius TaxID=109634 RepID=A0A9P5TFN4_GYMJU|nr:hypothetical protein CPB84DRAFT_1854809 [Gymnopilus junonius]